MEQSYLLYYIGAGVVGILIVGSLITFLRSRGKRKKRSGDKSEYVRALNYLIDGDLTRAIEYFYQAVRQDTENIDAYIKLGDIFRKQDKVDRAIKIHSELLVRRNLDEISRTEIIRSLVLDYAAAKRYDRALESLNSLFAIEAKNLWAKKQQLIIYEAKKDWDSAFRTYKQLARWEGLKEINDRLALYKVEAAKSKFEINNEKEARVLLREAIKLDPNCSAAYIELGDSYVREERFTDAIKIWVEFVRQVPQYSHLVFERLQEVLYSIGSYGEIENILQELHQEHPDNLDVIFTLADIRVRKGDVEGAIELCTSALEKEPDSVIARLKLVKLYDRNGEKEKALKMAMEVADSSSDSTMEFRCSECNFKVTTPVWHCSNCGAWNSYNI